MPRNRKAADDQKPVELNIKSQLATCIVRRASPDGTHLHIGIDLAWDDRNRVPEVVQLIIDRIY